ncbi:type IV secretion system protein VirB9 [Paucibacter sp. KBW04]|nr:type IV secretion system protein VirB9 [Paucibacter sp. KBW04]
MAAQTLAAQPPLTSPHRDPRLRELVYDPAAVVTVPVKRGVVTLIQLGEDETITDVGSGLGSDCSKADMTWCIATQSGGRAIFVKPKSGASEPNNLAVVSDKRTHSLRLVVLEDKDSKQPIYRLRISPAQAPAAKPRPLGATNNSPELPALALPDLPLPALPAPLDLVADRIKSKPLLRNTQYTLAQGKASDDIVPTLVFDDGLFTYLRFPGNREMPAVFQVLGDGSESLVNIRMDGDLLVVDRVSRQLRLRAGSAVVGIWNESFDVDGKPPESGATVPGVQRILKPSQLRTNAQGSKN